jgi:hypothetical protein
MYLVTFCQQEPCAYVLLFATCNWCVLIYFFSFCLYCVPVVPVCVFEGLEGLDIPVYRYVSIEYRYT